MSAYITIAGIEHYMGIESMKINQEFFLKKDIENVYDDEAIEVINDKGCRYGYVANSVSTVARGTHSAGYIYENIKNNTKCVVRFILEGSCIAEVISK